MFRSIEEIQWANKDAGYHWFDKGSMEFFDSIVYPELIQHPEGAYFVTSEKFDPLTSRLFTVRFAWPTGEVSTVSHFQGFATKEEALDWAREQNPQAPF